jgi:hypothetical protein
LLLLLLLLIVLLLLWLLLLLLFSWLLLPHAAAAAAAAAVAKYAGFTASVVQPCQHRQHELEALLVHVPEAALVAGHILELLLTH